MNSPWYSKVSNRRIYPLINFQKFFHPIYYSLLFEPTNLLNQENFHPPCIFTSSNEIFSILATVIRASSCIRYLGVHLHYNCLYQISFHVCDLEANICCSLQFFTLRLSITSNNCVILRLKLFDVKHGLDNWQKLVCKCRYIMYSDYYLCYLPMKRT